MKLLVAMADAAERSVCREAVRQLEGIEILSYAGTGEEAVQLAAVGRPELVVIAAELPQMDGFEATRMITLHSPATRVVIAAPSWDASHLQKAMAAGARHVIGLSLDADELRDALQGLAGWEKERERDEFIQATDPARAPITVAICGSKGGIGKTTIAVNLAASLAQMATGAVALVDLYPQFGDVASMLDIRPRSTLADLSTSGEDIEVEALRQLAVAHASGVAVFIGATAPQPLDVFSCTFVDNLIAGLRQTYRFVILDLPPLLFSGTLAAVTRSDCVLVVCPVTEVAAVASTRCYIDVLGEGFVSSEHLHVIANRTGRGAALQTAELEAALGRKVSMQIPQDDRRLTESVNAGQLIVQSQPASPVAAVILKMAQRIHDRQPIADPTVAGTAKGWTLMRGRTPESQVVG